MVPAIILAAGRSTRMGSAKALLRIGTSGPTFVDRLINALSSGGDRRLVATAGDPGRAVAVVRVLADAPTPEDVAQLRAASRALVPTVAVQLGVIPAGAAA